jgi:hypothetical protein
MAIDNEIRFSWILLGREPANEQELVYVFLAVSAVRAIRKKGTSLYSIRPNSGYSAARAYRWRWPRCKQSAISCTSGKR